MGKDKPKRPVTLPIDIDDEDEAAAFGIPDDDGWIYLKRDANAKPRPANGRSRKAGTTAPRRPGKNARKASRRGKQRRSNS